MTYNTGRYKCRVQANLDVTYAFSDLGLSGQNYGIDVKMIILHHHERYDGHGYPDGMDAISIPLSAHVLILADALDAMSSRRPYRSPLSQVTIREEFAKCAGSQFHPQVVEHALRLFFPPPSQETEAHPLEIQHRGS